jgi:hypothetical protein
LLAAAKNNESDAIDMVNLWGHGFRVGLGCSPAPGNWMAGQRVRHSTSTPSIIQHCNDRRMIRRLRIPDISRSFIEPSMVSTTEIALSTDGLAVPTASELALELIQTPPCSIGHVALGARRTCDSNHPELRDLPQSSHSLRHGHRTVMQSETPSTWSGRQADPSCPIPNFSKI